MPISVAIITPTLKNFGTIFCIMMFITVIGNSIISKFHLVFRQKIRTAFESKNNIRRGNFSSSVYPMDD